MNLPPRTDADLKSLQADAGTLSPAFSPDVFEYSLTVGDCRDSITITAGTNAPFVSVSGAGKRPLTVASSVFHIIVIAEDGSENDYAVSVRRLSCDATLKSLTLNNGAIPFRFSPYIFEYNRFEVEDEVFEIPYHSPCGTCSSV